MAGVLVRLTTGGQVIEFLAWAAFTGLLIARGLNASRATLSWATATLLASALVPVGFVVLAHQLNRIWPDTTEPTQIPAMAALLALYVLGVPWALGRLVRWAVPEDRSRLDLPRPISP